MGKIVEIIPSLSSGGAERFVVDLTNQISVDNDVTLIIIQKIEAKWFLVNQLSEKVKIISYNKEVGFSIKVLLKLTRYLLRENPDIVHTHLAAIYYIFLYSILRKKQSKLFHTLHSAALPEAEFKIGILYRKVLFKKLVTPVTISIESQNSFNELYSLPSYMIPNGRNVPIIEGDEIVKNEVELMRKTSSTKIIMNVASMLDCKNQYSLSRCIKNLTKEGYDVALCIIGRNTDSDILEQILDLQCDSIAVLGEKPNPLDYLFYADGFILSSKYEGMPISLIESFALGKISICTPVGGMVNMISDGVNGILSEDVSEDSISKSIIRFLSLSEEEKQKLSSNSKKSFENYTICSCANKYLDVFNE